MAQLGSAQREPSMEEILASIRRIIEDSDGGRRLDEPAVRPDNDAVPAAASAAPVVAPASAATASAGEATVIEVDAFRSGLQAEAPAKREAVSLADVQALVAADRAAAVSAAAADMARSSSEVDAARSAEPGAPAPERVEVPETRQAAAAEWRLGVSEPEPIEAADHADFDMDEMANAVLQDIAASQTASMSAEEESQPATGEHIRPAIISEHTGRQVAAAFGELSAARSRKSLDEMAEEMLRPMLQDWLDNNLPTLVERLVREEIERVARGA